jgi:hypothetical protein
VPKDAVPDMLQAQSFYEGHSLFQGLTWEFILERIGQDLREHYDVPRELPSNLLALVRKLDDDWLFPSVGGQTDADFFGR